MSEKDDSQIGQTTDQAMKPLEQKAEKMAKGVGKKGGGALRKATKKLRKKVTKKALLLAKKAVIAFIKALISFLTFLGPVVGGILLLAGLAVIVYHVTTENRGAQQEYDFKTEENLNEYTQETNEFGDLTVDSLSEQNAFLQIFYQNEVDESYWLYYKDGDDTVLDFAGGEEAKNEEVKDKYGREKFFQLSAMNLYALDEHLNKNNAITPQTFIQPVPFSINGEGRLEFESLTDDEGELQVKSHKFEQVDKDNEGELIYRKVYDDNEEAVLTEGVWDYGFAPVYHYEKFIEEREFRSSITGAQVWDQEQQRMRNMTTAELHEFTENGRLDVYDDWGSDYNLEEGQSRVEGSASDVPLVEEIPDETVWMIRDAVTPMGVIKNEIKQEWQQTGNVRNDTHIIKMNVPIEKEREVQAKDEKGRLLWNELVPQGRYVRTRMPLNKTGRYSGSGPRPIRTDPQQVTRYGWGVTPKGFPQIPSVPAGVNKISDQIPEGWEIEWRWVETGNQTTVPMGDDHIIWTTEIYYELVEKEHTVQTQGVEWEYVPKYDGEPDTSGLSGLDYYNDYFQYYENYVSEDSIGASPLDYLERAREEEVEGIKRGLGENEENPDGPEYGVPPTLEERKEGKGPEGRFPEHPLLKEVRELQLQHLESSTRAHVDLSDVDFGAESDSEAVQNATEFIDLFVEYGSRYGVDPMILVALAAHESQGRHFANPGEDQSSGVRRSYTYPENVGGEADTAAIGIMQVRPLNGGNPNKARGVTAFNQETGQMETFSATASELHDVETNIKFGAMLMSSEARIANYDILTGMASYHYGARFTQFVQEQGYGTWSPEAAVAYTQSNAGVPGYIQSVLKYYLPMESTPYPWAMDEDGNINGQQVEGVDFATDSAINIDIANSVAQQRRGGGGSLERGAKAFAETLKTWGVAPFKLLAEATEWLFDGVKAITDYFGWTSNMDTEDYYRISSNLNSTEAETLIYTMLAYEEGLYLHAYEEMTIEDFEERFIASFMQHVRETDRTGMRINPLDYFPDGHQKPVDTVTITRKYGSHTRTEAYQPGIQLEVPGSTKIYAVANGTIAEIGDDYVVIDHGGGVRTHYKQLGEVVLEGEVGDEVEKGWTIARGATSATGDNIEPNSFLFQLEKNTRFADPTWIVDPSVISGGTVGIDPNATDFQHPYYGLPEGSYTMSSPWGWRIHPIEKVRKLHAGQDWSTDRKPLPIGAIGDGVVVANKYHSGWGHLIVIHHDDVDTGDGRNIFSLYAHMKSPSPLSVGQRVSRGDVVGNTGTTGGSTGVHLHLEIILHAGDNPLNGYNPNNTIDPKTVLP